MLKKSKEVIKSNSEISVICLELLSSVPLRTNRKRSSDVYQVILHMNALSVPYFQKSVATHLSFSFSFVSSSLRKFNISAIKRFIGRSGVGFLLIAHCSDGAFMAFVQINELKCNNEKHPRKKQTINWINGM